MNEEGMMIIIIFGSILLYIIFLIIYAKKNKTVWEEDAKFAKHINEYKNYMKATGKNTLKDIALEFNEDIFDVEKNVRRAIRINILKGYYLCNQTGEILPIHSFQSFFPRKRVTIKESKSIKIKE